MPRKPRVKTRYPGVYYVGSKAIGSGKPERVYYLLYRKHGKLVDEKAGRQFQDTMTPAKAAQIRVQRIQGDVPSNSERRKQEHKPPSKQHGLSNVYGRNTRRPTPASRE